jgi:hypothetical protein
MRLSDKDMQSGMFVNRLAVLFSSRSILAYSTSQGFSKGQMLYCWRYAHLPYEGYAVPCFRQTDMWAQNVLTKLSIPATLFKSCFPPSHAIPSLVNSERVVLLYD